MTDHRIAATRRRHDDVDRRGPPRAEDAERVRRRTEIRVVSARHQEAHTRRDRAKPPDDQPLGPEPIQTPRRARTPADHRRCRSTWCTTAWWTPTTTWSTTSTCHCPVRGFRTTWRSPRNYAILNDLPAVLGPEPGEPALTSQFFPRHPVTFRGDPSAYVVRSAGSRPTRRTCCTGPMPMRTATRSCSTASSRATRNPATSSRFAGPS